MNNSAPRRICLIWPAPNQAALSCSWAGAIPRQPRQARPDFHTMGSAQRPLLNGFQLYEQRTGKLCAAEFAFGAAHSFTTLSPARSLT